MCFHPAQNREQQLRKGCILQLGVSWVLGTAQEDNIQSRTTWCRGLHFGWRARNSWAAAPAITLTHRTMPGKKEGVKIQLPWGTARVLPFLSVLISSLKGVTFSKWKACWNHEAISNASPALKGQAEFFPSEIMYFLRKKYFKWKKKLNI